MKTKMYFFGLIGLIFSSLITHAQIEKGTWMIGGNFSGGTNKSESSDTVISSKSSNFNLNIRPQVGYFIIKNLVMGASVGYSYSNSSSENIRNTTNIFTYNYYRQSVSKSQNLSLGVFAGYYVPINERIYFTTYAGLGYSTPLFTSDQSKIQYTNGTTTEYTIDNSKTTRSSFSASLEPGISFFVTPKLAIEASLGVLNFYYNSFKDSQRQSNQNASGINFGINSISLGFRYFLPKKA